MAAIREREMRDVRDRERERDRDRDRDGRDSRDSRDGGDRRDRGDRPPRDFGFPRRGRGRFENERDNGRPMGGANIPARPKVVIDREKVCPLLIRVFTSTNGHHTDEDFAAHLSAKSKETAPLAADELHIHTWKDATLREIMDLVKQVRPSARQRDARMSFSFVYPDKRGRYVLREAGKTHSSRKGEDDNKTLDELRFVPGDFLDVAIYS